MTSERKIKAEEAFQALLDGAPAEANAEIAALAKLASALEPAPATAPDPRFKARLRSTLLAHASADEDAFAHALDGAGAMPAEIRPLVAVAQALEPATRPLPSVEFRYELRRKLIAQATRQPVGARVAGRVAALNERMRRSLRVVGATGLAAVMLAGSSVSAAASSSALPVDPLYKVKRWRESAQLAFRSDESRGVRHLEHARTRLGEIKGMTERPVRRSEPYEQTFDDMDSSTLRGTSLLIGVYRETKKRDLVLRVDRFARAQVEDLAAMLERLPPAALPAARDSLAVAAQVVRRAQNVLAGCSPCSSDALVPAPDGAPRDESGVDCACEVGSGSDGSPDGSGGRPDRDGSGDGSGDGDGSGNGGNGGGGNGGGDGDGGSRTEIPDVPGTDIDDEAEDLINELLNQLPTPLQSPAPLPETSLPPLTSPLPSVSVSL